MITTETNAQFIVFKLVGINDSKNNHELWVKLNTKVPVNKAEQFKADYITYLKNKYGSQHIFDISYLKTN